jgi:protease I
MSTTGSAVSESTVPRRALVLVAAGYRDLEFWYPVLRLREAGLEVDILGTEGDGTVRSELGYPVIPNGAIASATVTRYDVVVVPGGAAGETLASDETAVALVTSTASSGGLVVTIGTGAGVADAAGIMAPTCQDADGLPELMRNVMAGLGK